MDTGRDWGGGGAESNADDTAWASRAETASTVFIGQGVDRTMILRKQTWLFGWAVVSLSLQIRSTLEFERKSTIVVANNVWGVSATGGPRSFYFLLVFWSNSPEQRGTTCNA